MAQEAWRWLLAHLTDESLANLARQTKVKVDGFRSITSENVKKIRPLLVQRLLLRLRDPRHVPTRSNPEWDAIRAKTEEELLAELQTGQRAAEVMLALLTSPDAGHRVTADKLLERAQALTDKGAERTVEGVDRSEEDSAATSGSDLPEQSAPAASDSQLRKLERKLRASQARADQLQQELSNQKKTFESELKALRASLQELNRELEAERRARAAVQASREEAERAAAKWEREAGQYKEQVAKQQMMVDELHKQLAMMDRSAMADAFSRAEAERAQRSVAAGGEPASQTDAGRNAEGPNRLERPSGGRGAPVVARRLPTVALVCRRTKATEDVCRTLRFHIQLVDVDELSQILQSPEQVAAFDEFWLLTHETTARQQRNVRRAVPTGALREFHSHLELQNFVNA
ncbi:MAG: hypothetical protein K6T78_14075 [Alicyclobacillus sp.]|nr:hypothetical protein [Alicyclobacillus sp.]